MCFESTVGEMKIPSITGIIRRRILLNYRIDPEVVESILPDGFRPKLVQGYAIAGICLIRLERIRPKGLPSWTGISSENAAHRIAVKWWDSDGMKKEGVFVPRRDTDSRFNALVGGRLFPGVHRLSRFQVNDDGQSVSLRVDASDSAASLVDLKVHVASVFPAGSVFSSLSESSDFFEGGSVGYSPRPDSSRLDGLLLKVPDWKVSVVDVEYVQSSFFDDKSIFPEGSIQFDHALMMRNIPHEWQSEPEMKATKQFGIQSMETVTPFAKQK